ncbi:hypothetical protein J6590_008385 [Homalodisca vitripennis]|nr:hypothetical protein J6590_008385 [Homalodisca vitripennis]
MRRFEGRSTSDRSQPQRPKLSTHGVLIADTRLPPLTDTTNSYRLTQQQSRSHRTWTSKRLCCGLRQGLGQFKPN